MATPYPKLRRNVAYNTVFVKRVTSQGGAYVEGCTMVLEINK